MSGELVIGEVAKRTGVRASALRYYERLGLLPKADRVGGRRVYGPEALDLLAVIRLARGVGLSIREVSELFAEGVEPASARWQRLASRKIGALEEQIQSLRLAQGMLKEMQRCRCLDLRVCGRAVRQLEAKQERTRKKPRA